MFCPASIKNIADMLLECSEETETLFRDITSLVSIYLQSLEGYNKFSNHHKNVAVISVFIAFATVVHYNRDLVEDILRKIKIPEEAYRIFQKISEEID